MPPPADGKYVRPAVLIKMDPEGAELDIIDRLLENGNRRNGCATVIEGADVADVKRAPRPLLCALARVCCVWCGAVEGRGYTDA